MDVLRTISIIPLLMPIATALCASCYPEAKHSVPLYSVSPAGNLFADITIGDQTLRGIVDTGSSSSWFMGQNVQCLNETTGKPISGHDCGFPGPPLKPSSSFKPTGTFGRATYASNESYETVNGNDQVQFGGIHIPKQEIGRAVTFKGSIEESASGFIGLAYPGLTFDYSIADCNNTKNITGCKNLHSSPILTTIFTDGLAPPVFALAISRSIPNAGVMTIGGIPDLQEPSVNISSLGSASNEATVPIEKVAPFKDYYTFYGLTVDGLKYPGAAAGAGKSQFIVDLGTSELVVGEDEAKAINALFDPPATYVNSQGSYTYMVPCNATPPDLGIEIGGKVFGMNSQDMIQDMGDGTCQSAVQGGLETTGNPNILGTPFLKNALAVFDVGETQMTFASRMYYAE